MGYRVAFFMVGEATRLTTAAIFVLAAYHAMREWTLFGGIVEQYQVAPRGLSLLAARVLPPLECMTAVALLLPATSRVGVALGLCLMILFTGAIALNLARGRVTIDCGCGGATGQKLSGGLVVRNLLVALGLVVAWMAPTEEIIDSGTTIGVIGATASLIALYFASNQLITNFQAFRALDSRTPW